MIDIEKNKLVARGTPPPNKWAAYTSRTEFCTKAPAALERAEAELANATQTSKKSEQKLRNIAVCGGCSEVAWGKAVNSENYFYFLP